MTGELENALRRTFEDAAERAPKAPPGIGLGPRTSRTRSGPSRTMLAAAAAVVAVAGTTIGGHALLSSSPGKAVARHVTAAPSPPLHRVKKMNVPAIEKIWPGVTFRLPKTLPNGRVFRPAVIIDAHTIAATTESSFEKVDAIYAYDLRNHATRRIATVVTPPHSKVFANGFTVGGGYIAWWLDDGTQAEIWAAPISGGQSRLVAKTDGRELSELAVDGEDAVWSPDPAGGVYRAPLAGGGTARMVPGSASMHLLMWPWIGTPLPRVRVDYGVAFAHVRNAVTGETRSAHLTDKAIWQCGPTWCVGSAHNSVTEVQHRDGSGRRAIPDPARPFLNPPVLDRFVITFPSGGTVAVYDLLTGKIGDLRVQGKGDPFVAPLTPSNPLCWAITNNGYVVVDLGAI